MPCQEHFARFRNLRKIGVIYLTICFSFRNNKNNYNNNSNNSYNIYIFYIIII